MTTTVLCCVLHLLRLIFPPGDFSIPESSCNATVYAVDRHQCIVFIQSCLFMIASGKPSLVCKLHSYLALSIQIF